MLTNENIEAELSYAYLHAVAARAGFECVNAGRHSDSAGVDATVKHDGRKLAADSLLTYVMCDIQLKATYQELAEANGKLSFPLPVNQYDRLRSTRLANPRLLVVLRLPRDPAEWLRVSEDALIAKRCAYWVSLRGADDVIGQKEKTVYLPTANRLTPDALAGILSRFSRQEVIPYEGK